MEEKTSAGPEEACLSQAPAHSPGHSSGCSPIESPAHSPGHFNSPGQFPVATMPSPVVKETVEPKAAVKRQSFTIDNLAKSSAAYSSDRCDNLCPPPVAQSGPTDTSMSSPFALASPQSGMSSRALVARPKSFPYSAIQTIGASSPSDSVTIASPYGGAASEDHGTATPLMPWKRPSVDAASVCSSIREEDSISSDSAYESLCDTSRTCCCLPSVCGFQDVAMETNMASACPSLDQHVGGPRNERAENYPPKGLARDDERGTPPTSDRLLTAQPIASFTQAFSSATASRLPPGVPTYSGDDTGWVSSTPCYKAASHELQAPPQPLSQLTLSPHVDLFTQPVPAFQSEGHCFDIPPSLNTPVLAGEPAFPFPPVSPILAPSIAVVSPVKQFLDHSSPTAAAGCPVTSSSTAVSPLLHCTSPAGSGTTDSQAGPDRTSADVDEADGLKNEDTTLVNDRTTLTTAVAEKSRKRSRSSKPSAKRKMAHGSDAGSSGSESEPEAAVPGDSAAGAGGSGEAKRKPRTLFTTAQLSAMESAYSAAKYLTLARRAEVAKSAGLDEKQVKTWFQNRRMKEKRNTNNEYQHQVTRMPTGGVDIRDLATVALATLPVESRVPAGGIPYVTSGGNQPGFGMHPAWCSSGECCPTTNIYNRAAMSLSAPSASWPSSLPYMTSSSLPLFQTRQYIQNSFAAASPLPGHVAQLARQPELWGTASPAAGESTPPNHGDADVSDVAAKNNTAIARSWSPCTRPASGLNAQQYADYSKRLQPPAFLPPAAIAHLPNVSPVISTPLSSSSSSPFFTFPAPASHIHVDQPSQYLAAVQNSKPSAGSAAAPAAVPALANSLQSGGYHGDAALVGDGVTSSNCSPLQPAVYYPHPYW